MSNQEENHQEDDSNSEETITENRKVEIKYKIKHSGQDEDYSDDSEDNQVLSDTDQLTGGVTITDPKDETDRFLMSYFSQKRWEQKPKKPTEKEIEEDDDLDEIYEQNNFEEHYNLYHHQEENFHKLQSNPRSVEGESRVREKSRKRKRHEEALKAKEREESFNKKLDEIDEKFKAFAEANNGQLTDEQLQEYTDAYANVLLEEQEDKFEYTQNDSEINMKASLKILDEEDNGEEESEEDEVPQRKDHNSHQRGREFHGHGRGRRGRGGRGQFRHNTKNRGMSNSRLDAYSSHK